MVKLPPPIWALIYVVVTLALSWLLGWPVVPGLPLPVLGIALTFLAWVLPVWAAIRFRRAGTEINPTSPTNRALVVDGPYRVTRNPMYLGLVLTTLGIAIWIGAWPMFLAPVAVFLTANFVHIPFEEAKMRRQFDGAFDDYVRQVRRWV
ncbi:MAG TPA: isoprenylcysteine carboxylmethyltransferase family protein [Bradyrhizobium sp.]|uniref:methyltransferase family protein n=1 Tax=Bradyrhizobium sp. TaxID=376 RepID=UPI002D7E3CAA|nr:isoprenylcysteine carboxylmethyltransferase family protein [Bradyrhizobium sp.]HET7886264.1 isoprenylcysteine carboxylmethyltransferase family protein [Bradyrhizobium sp.]